MSEINGILKSYVRAVFRLNADGSLRGRGRVAQEIGIDDDMALYCHRWLKQHNLIQVRDNRTFPLATKAQVLNTI